LAIPAFNAIRGGTDFTSAVYSISGALQEGRAYAMANNTFVLVGFQEVSASQNASASPQINGVGRLAIAIIASRDGTRPYQSLINTPSLTGSNYLTLPAPAGYGSGTRYTVVSKLITLTNVHMVDLQSSASQQPMSGGMQRPWHTDYPNYTQWEDYSLGDTVDCAAGNCFLWPLGTSLTGSPVPQYTFTQVIEFDPQGSARILAGSTQGSAAAGTVSQTSIPYFIEIGLEVANGATANPAPTVEQASGTTSPGQIAAIQVDGMTGATHIYRP